ncbi:methyltransferase domain-containing protein [Conexivisphaera calida]|uniref:Protein-N(5)-glutamine methyltransferase PrmC n=1 Tax=Conexivisphaera calida TaxID=1874277 RepID=A0A4P2VPR6_9ARCH|nr:methyltransferase domain-containing protein [Conexivisphaera calida]BBE42865.1 Protein-N(5)-glutamine methyltransferase PrmC [Conexivisphaera calida]
MPQPYRPSDDSALLLDCVRRSMEMEEDRGGMRGLELGCGTGFVTRGLFDAGVLRIAACGDVSVEAAEEARDRLRGAPLDAVICDAAGAFRDSAFDLVYFNPPYLPCDYEEDSTVCGGRNGIELALSFLESSRGSLRPGGRMYALMESDCAGEFLENAERLGLTGGVRCRLRLFFEELVVLELELRRAR